jgi:hypothetical protein
MTEKILSASTLAVFALTITVGFSSRAAETNGTTASAATTNSSSKTVTQKEVTIPGKGNLRLTFPNGWQISADQVKELGIPVQRFQFHPTDGAGFAILLEIIPVDMEKARGVNPHDALLRPGQMELVNSVEKELNIQDFQGEEATGSYFTLTDKKLANTAQPPPGEYKYVTQGFAKLEDLILNFRIVSNQPAGVEKTAALEMIKTACLSRPAKP